MESPPDSRPRLRRALGIALLLAIFFVVSVGLLLAADVVLMRTAMARGYGSVSRYPISQLGPEATEWWEQRFPSVEEMKVKAALWHAASPPTPLSPGRPLDSATESFIRHGVDYSEVSGSGYGLTGELFFGVGASGQRLRIALPLGPIAEHRWILWRTTPVAAGGSGARHDYEVFWGRLMLSSLVLTTVLFLVTVIPWLATRSWRRNARRRIGKCAQCGQLLYAEQRVCPECGTERRRVPMARAAPVAAPGERRRIILIGGYIVAGLLMVLAADFLLCRLGVQTGWRYERQVSVLVPEELAGWARRNLQVTRTPAEDAGVRLPLPVDPWDNYTKPGMSGLDGLDAPPTSRLMYGVMSLGIDNGYGVIEGELLITHMEHAWRLRVPMPAGPIMERSYIGPPGTIPPEPPDSAWRTEVRWLSLLGNTLIFAVVLALLTLLPLRIFRNRRAAWRAQRGRCPSCGYAALTPDHPVCPNCGPVGGGARSTGQVGQLR
jgi:ribosomal protein L32